LSLHDGAASSVFFMKMTNPKWLHERTERSAPVVLVVDDNDDVRDMVVAWIEVHGFKTAAAANGLEALACLSQGLRPTLIVLDLRMPGMNGWDVLRWLKTQGELRAIPVAITSAEDERPVGGTYFLRKPIDFDVLIRIVRT